MSGYVLIPTFGLRHGGVPAKVQLPVIANPWPIPSIILAFVGSLLGSLFLVPSGIMLAMATLRDVATLSGVGGVVVLISFAALGVVALTCSAICIADLLIERPVVVVDETGISDVRAADGMIPWESVRKVISLEINGGVLMELHHPRKTRINRFRVGTLGFIWKERPNDVYISLNWAIGPYLPHEVILALAARHGAEVFEKHPRQKDLKPATIVRERS